MALVIDKLSILSEKKDDVWRCWEKWESLIVEYDEEKFEKDSKNNAMAPQNQASGGLEVSD